MRSAYSYSTLWSASLTLLITIFGQHLVNVLFHRHICCTCILKQSQVLICHRLEARTCERSLFSHALYIKVSERRMRKFLKYRTGTRENPLKKSNMQPLLLPPTPQTKISCAGELLSLPSSTPHHPKIRPATGRQKVLGTIFQNVIVGAVRGHS